MRVSEKGQITIPKDLRDELGIGAGSDVAVTREGDTIVLRKTEAMSRGRSIVERMRGRGDGTMTTDEIMSLTRGDGDS
jgi:antitoxin PrlF